MKEQNEEQHCNKLFEVSPAEATQLWTGGIRLIGNNDIKLLEEK